MGMMRRVNKKTVEEVMTCFICLKFMINPFALPECLHIFCRDCISNKITKERDDKCPICKTEIGGAAAAALDRLRPDHIMASFISKLAIAYNKSEENPQKKLNSKRVSKDEEKKIVNIKKNTTRSACKGKGPIIAEEEREECEQNVCTAHRSNRSHSVVIREPNQTTDRNRQKPKVDYEGKGKAPLLVEVENSDSEDDTYFRQTIEEPQRKPRGRPRTAKFEQGGSSKHASKVKMDKINHEKITHANGVKADHGKINHKKKSNQANGVKADHGKINHEKKSNHAKGVKAGPAKTKSEKKNIQTSKIKVNQAKENRETRMIPIWLALLAYDQEGCQSLPQIQQRFLRIRDSSQTISSLQKYIMFKFGLHSEDEVEICLFGEPLPSTMILHSLIRLYSQRGFAVEEIIAKPGDSGEDYVMILYYRRKSH